jgi:hypothetical protein
MSETKIDETKDLPKLEAIKIITKGDKMSLVEYMDGSTLHRVSIQNKDIKDGFVATNVLHKGIPYGIPYETLDFPHLSAQDIGDVFKNHGIWIASDFRNKPKEVTSALMTIAGKFYSVLLAYIKNK